MAVPSDRLPPLETDQRVAGIDWAKDDHAVAVVDAAGRLVERFTVAHTLAGLRELLRRLGRPQVGEVAIERPELDGLMSLKFLSRFDCQDRADWLPPPSARR